ncbi:hypothetical protein AQUCO_01100086v1 [Aquilegia coerulea]|uniref:Uncharacterized protein n=2 Tax=Aquilegia coerulea TaxID=218851 RepID=A0A2G5E5G8_AQUCA|nr:hypothetical protein AQUCO_01100086v1 [Aquilegia coerulea]
MFLNQMTASDLLKRQWTTLGIIMDHLVNNAGIASVFFFEKSTDISKSLPVMDVNFWGSVYPTQFALPHLKKSKGKILVIASVSGWMYGTKISFYGASKAALLNFYDTLRVEFSSSVKITIASPGFTRTAMLRGKQLNMEGSVEINKSKTDAVLHSLPLRSASECAKAIVKGVCRGDRDVTDPSWYGIFYVLKFFIPEIMEMFLHRINIIPRNNMKKNVDVENISATSGIKMS